MTDRKKNCVKSTDGIYHFSTKQTKTKQPRQDCCHLQMFVPKLSCLSKAKHNVQEDLIFTSLISFSLKMKKFFCQFKQIKQNAIWRIGISCQISLLTLDQLELNKFDAIFYCLLLNDLRQKDRRTEELCKRFYVYIQLFLWQ